MAHRKWKKKKHPVRQRRAKKYGRRAVARRLAPGPQPAPVLAALAVWVAGQWNRVRQFKIQALPAWRIGVAAGTVYLLLAVLVPVWMFLAATPPDVLWCAYPGAVNGFQQTPRGWFFLLSNGLDIPYRDGLKLTPEERLDQADLAAVLSQPYPFGEISLPAGVGQEPGRFRNYALVEAAYGGTLDEVRRNLVVVDFLGLGLEFNAKNGAAQALQDVARDIRADPEACAYVNRVAGTHLQKLTGTGLKRSPNISSWNWRCIAGTQRLSMHSFGIAVDLNMPGLNLPSYWRWISPRRFPRGLENVKNLERVSWRVVEIFEKHGFIWGGKWHHFDTMHFEYRPEFLAARQHGLTGYRDAVADKGGRRP